MKPSPPFSSSQIPRPRRSERFCVSSVRPVFCLFLACVLLVTTARAQEARPSEYQIEAVYLYNFSHFVEWPSQGWAGSGEPFSVCVLGKDPFGSVLDSTLSGERVGNQGLVVKRISTPQEAFTCRILFVSASEESRLADILTALDKMSILTVSDIPRFSQRGGMIQFLTQGQKVRFEVNLTNARDARLTLSSDLLKVAVTVRQNPQSGY